MQITLQRQVKAVCHQVLATVNVEQERPDLQRILKQVEDDIDCLPPRLIDYLEKEKLIKNNGLTMLGGEVIDSGKHSATERGIYQIWYLQDDAYLTQEPLLMQRVVESNTRKGGYQQRNKFYEWAETEKIVRESKYNCDFKTVFLNDGTKVQKNSISNLCVEVLNAGIKNKQQYLTLTLTYSLDKGKFQVDFKLTGKLPTKINEREQLIDINNEYSDEHNDAFMSSIISSLDMQWEKSTSRSLCKTPKDYEALATFIMRKQNLSSINTCFGRFEQGEVHFLPIEPKDVATAKEWQRNWLNELFKMRYLSVPQANYSQQIWLAHPAVKHYKLPLLQGPELLNELDRQQDPISYWHASAASFLIPANTQTPLPSITFKKDDELNISDFFRKLVLSESVKHIVYSDRHYKSAQHARNMREIVRISGAKSGVIYSCDPNAKIPEDWTLKAMKSKKDNHDRYWIIQTMNRTIIWKVTTSLDFIDFSHKMPKIQSPTTFVQLEESDLPDYLQQALSINIAKEAIA
ncbi:hypothetical protein ACU5DF_00945 [Aliivibrio wodanis]|uniref:hypothetical protein n=1 Tax=Aliivibrio wodanis TaxID=80852 RepID=UPI00406CC5FA